MTYTAKRYVVTSLKLRLFMNLKFHIIMPLIKLSDYQKVSVTKHRLKHFLFLPNDVDCTYIHAYCVSLLSLKQEWNEV